MKIRVFACFLVRALPKVRDQIRKQFFDKVLYNYCSNFFLPLHPKKWRSKNGFPIVFSKSDFGGGDSFFCQTFFLKMPNTPEYAQVLVVTWVKPNSVTVARPGQIAIGATGHMTNLIPSSQQ